MANLTFADLQNEVFAHTGLDSTDATNTTNVNRWINYVQQDLCARWPWQFLEGRQVVQTIPDITTGTVSINSGATSVTGTSTNWTFTFAAGTQYIQFAGSNDWYQITALSSPTSLSINGNYTGTVNAVNVAYIIRVFYYQLASSTDRIIDARNWNTPVKLVNVDVRTLDDIRPNPQSTNSSYGYICWGVNPATGNLMVGLYPYPSDVRNIELRVLLRPTDMAGSTDVPSIPNKYAHLLAWGAIAIGYSFLRKMDIAEAWNAKLEQRVMQMRSEYRMTEDYQPVMRSIDSIQRSKWLQFPDQYPVVMG